MRTSTAQAARSATAVRSINDVVLGEISFKTWYPSFYPEALVGKHLDTLYVCKQCFAYSNNVHAYLTHTKLCEFEDPPGDLIYEKDDCSIYEIDGEDEKLFAQNLSLFAKLFLDNKSVFFDVVGFKYYLLVSTLPGSGFDATPTPTPQIVGFFSKEKNSWDLNNLACILVFPPWQRRSLGKILMGISYSLSRRDGRIGGPEKPLSELGRRGYLAFWQARVAIEVLGMKNKTSVVEVEELATRCSMAVEDVIAALREMALCEKKRNGDVTISKVKVRDWAARTKINLTPPVDEDAFIERETTEEADGDETGEDD